MVDHSRIGNRVVAHELGMNLDIEGPQCSAHTTDDVVFRAPETLDSHRLSKVIESIVLRTIRRRQDDSPDPLRTLDSFDLALQERLSIDVTEHLPWQP